MPAGTPGAPAAAGNKLPLIIGAVVVGVAVVGGIGYMMMSGKGPAALVGGGAAPSATVEKAFKAMLDQTSVDMEGTIGLSAESAGLQVDFDLKGVPLPAAEKDSVSTEGSLNISGSIEESPVSVSLDMRTIPPRTYFNLASFSGAEEMMGGLPMDGFLDRWIFVDAEEGAENPLEGFTSEFVPVGLPEGCETTETQEKAAEDYLKALSMDDVAEVSRIRSGNGVTTYSVEPDMEKLKEISQEVAELSGCEEEVMGEDDMFTVNRLDVGVDDQSGLIRSIDFDLSGEMDGEPSTVSGEITLGNYNRAPDVEVPEDAVSFEQLMEEMMSVMFGDLFGDMMLEEGMMLDDSSFEFTTDDMMYDDSSDSGMPSQEEIDALFEGMDFEANL